MTPEAQRIAIARACGKTCRYCGGSGLLPAFSPDEYREISKTFNVPKVQLRSLCGYLCEMPDYLNDLNAMHEAEKLFDGVECNDSLRYQYSHRLYLVVTPASTQPFRATAVQRAEAFLRTIGKWDDTK